MFRMIDHLSELAIMGCRTSSLAEHDQFALLKYRGKRWWTRSEEYKLIPPPIAMLEHYKILV